MNISSIIAHIEYALSKKMGIAKLFFLIEERKKIDDGIFATSGWFDSSYKSRTLEMIFQNDKIDSLSLEADFDDYKKKWGEIKKRWFDTTQTLNFQDFLDEFQEYLPQDIIESIRKSGSTDLSGLEISDSIEIMEGYLELRNWLNERIQDEVNKNHLTDNDIQSLISKKIKLEWQGSSPELIGLFDVLEERKWVHVSVASSRAKAQLIESIFTQKDNKPWSKEYLSKTIKNRAGDSDPFQRIERNN